MGPGRKGATADRYHIVIADVVLISPLRVVGHCSCAVIQSEYPFVFIPFHRRFLNFRRSMRRPQPRFVMRAVVASALMVGACDDGPTSLEPCTLVALGPTLSFVVPSASALQPALVDAQQRLLPGLSTPAPIIASAISDFSTELATADQRSRCIVYNRVVAEFQRVAAVAPVVDGPEIEGIRLAIRLAHAYLETN